MKFLEKVKEVNLMKILNLNLYHCVRTIYWNNYKVQIKSTLSLNKNNKLLIMKLKTYKNC